MGKIYYLMGKSASGKDSLYKELLHRMPELKKVVMYTTRPMREGEKDGVQYFFITEDKYYELLAQNLVIEHRDYQTVYGIWSYLTVRDHQIDLEKGDYLMIGTLESYDKMCEAYGQEVLEPLYITVDDGVRLQRALERERQQSQPKYAELCRRFLADESDFSPENLEKSRITRAFVNDSLETCLDEITAWIRRG